MLRADNLAEKSALFLLSKKQYQKEEIKMSMETNCIYGYGFKVYVSDENLRLFIEKHEETIRKIRILQISEGSLR